MDLWKSQKWKEHIEEDRVRTGLRLRFDKNVETDVRESMIRYVKWLRTQYVFPMRVPVYMKETPVIKAQDGDLVTGTFLGPYDMRLEPYIRVATGDYEKISRQKERDDAIATIIVRLSHELTHYYQWINALELTDAKCERQARYYAEKRLDEYRKVCEHP